MDKQRKRTEIALTILTVFLVIAGISVVLFFLVTSHYISLGKDWALILLAYFIIIFPIVVFLLFPALLGEPFFTRTQAEWDDPFEREIILDIPFQSAFDRCLDSTRLLMRDGRLDWDSPSNSLLRDGKTDWITPSYPGNSLLQIEWPRIGLLSYEGRIMVNERDTGKIVVITHERWVSYFYPLDFPIRSTVTYSLKGRGPSQTQVHVRSSRTPRFGPAYGINRKYVDAVCEFLLSEK